MRQIIYYYIICFVVVVMNFIYYIIIIFSLSLVFYFLLLSFIYFMGWLFGVVGNVRRRRLAGLANRILKYKDRLLKLFSK